MLTRFGVNPPMSGAAHPIRNRHAIISVAEVVRLRSEFSRFRLHREVIEDQFLRESWIGVSVFALVTVLLSCGCQAKTNSPNPSPTSTKGDGKSKAAVVARIPRPSRPHDDFVGSQVCATCHAEIAASYSAHPMAQSLAAVTEARPLEDYENRTSFQPSGPRKYRVERRSDEVFHHEVRENADGSVLYDQAVPIHFSVGSGQRGRSFLTNRDGLLFMSSIGWYSSGAGWDLSPGYRPESHPRFERQVSDGCIMCHAGRVAPIAGQPATFEAHQPFLEESIGCERCHGPAATHVARHQKLDPTLVDQSVNPAKLDAVRQDAVCNQCHLQGGKRTLRYGREEQDFRPGDRLGDIWVVSLDTEAGGQGDSVRAVTQASQMQESVCFQKSQNLRCVSCHDPHRHAAPEDRHVFYDSRCVTCHGPSSTECAESPLRREAKSCVECHMPRLSTSDVPHTTQTDHRVPRSNKAPKRPMIPRANDDFAFHREGDLVLPEWEVQRARGLLISNLTETSQDASLASQAVALLEPLRERLPDDTELLNALGVAHLQQDNSQAAIKFWELSLQVAPKRATTLHLLAMLHHQSGDLKQARHYYARLIEVNPWRSEYFGRYSHVLGQLGEYEAAIQAGLKCAELDPTLAHIHGWLAGLYKRRGQPELSPKHEEMFRQLSPPQK